MREVDGTTIVTCPDGSRRPFTEDDALSCGLPEPAIERLLPGVQVTDRAEPKSTRLSLSEGSVAIFDCERR